MIKICIPSSGRFQQINKDTLNIIPKKEYKNVYVFVNPVSELEDYKKYGKKDINYVGVNIKNNITKVRNYILDYFEEGQEIFMMDDDITRIVNRKLQRKDTEIMKIINRYFLIAKEMKVKLFGFEPTGNPMNCYYKDVFSYFGFAIQAVGIILDKRLRYDNKMLLKEDIDYSCEHFKMFGMTPIFKAFTFSGKVKSNKGGCKNYRNLNLEKKCSRYLIDKYPYILSFKKGLETEIVKQDICKKIGIIG